MLQFIMDRNVLLYVLAAACAVGAASQIILKQIYDRLIKDTKNTGEPAGRFLLQLRQRFQYCSHLNERVGDVQALIRRSLTEYRFWGMGLHRWKRIGTGCLMVSLLCAFGGTMKLVRDGAHFANGNTYFWMGILAAAVTAAAYRFADTGYREQVLLVDLTDYLENSGAVRSYREQEDPEKGYDEAYTDDSQLGTPIVSVSGGRKLKNRVRAENAAARETRAQREKRELKENLAHIRAGIQETAAAASGTGKDSRAELLRQMDPKEQERILKEVLKEFLS